MAGLAIATALLVQRLGAGAFWAVAIAGHVASTLLVYAGFGLVWLISPASVGDVSDRPDYGVSAVWLAVLGALFLCAVRALRSGTGEPIDRVLVVVCPLAAVIGFAFFPLLSGCEHLAAFFAGVLVAAVMAGEPGEQSVVLLVQLRLASAISDSGIPNSRSISWR